jgi:hypothetical protein
VRRKIVMGAAFQTHAKANSENHAAVAKVLQARVTRQRDREILPEFFPEAAPAPPPSPPPPAPPARPLKPPGEPPSGAAPA